MANWRNQTFYKYTWILSLVLLICSAGLGVYRRIWIEKLESDSQARSKELALSIGNQFVGGKVLTDKMYRKIIEQDPSVGYVVAANYRTGYRSGAVNSEGLRNGGQDVATYLATRGDAETLGRLILKEGGFPGEYLDVYSVALLPPASVSERTPLGTMKISYLVPGFPYGRGYYRIWAAFSSAVSLLTVFLFAGWMSQRKLEARKIAAGIGRVDLGSLEELEDGFEDEDTTSVIDEAGREWKILFDGKSLDGWVARGDWYITEREIAGQPWGASLIYTDVVLQSSYSFQLRAKKIAGPDGFIILFMCDGKSLDWVVGGWDNIWSEVAGYPETRKNLTIDRFLWYKLEVRVGPSAVEGLVEDNVVWKIERKEIKQSSPEFGFQKGLGMAVWNTLAKYKDIRFLSL